MSAVNREKYMRGKRIAIDHLNDDLRSRLLHSKGGKKRRRRNGNVFLCVCLSPPPLFFFFFDTYNPATRKNGI
jgi:hypothetical protein